MWCELNRSVVNNRRVEASSVGLCRRWRRTFWTLLMIAALKITMSKWQHCIFDNWRWLSVLFCCKRKWTKNNRVFNWKTEKCCYLNLQSKVRTQLRWCGKFYNSPCRIYSRLKWYKNYKNRLRLAKVIVKNKMSRFLWFTDAFHACTIRRHA